MNIQCPKCQTSYNVNITPEEMPEKGSKFSCQNCKHKFFVRKKQESSFISLMKNIKDKLDDWDDEVNGKNLSEDKKGAYDGNRQESTGESLEAPDEEVDDFLNEILDEEESEKKAQLMTEQIPPATEIEMETEDLDDEELEKIFEEVDPPLEETLQKPTETPVEEESPPPVEETAAVSEPEVESGSANQEDIDNMLEEAVSQQLNGTSENSAKSSSEEESPAPAEEVAAASEAESGQEDIDKLFAEATSQQLNGSLQDSADSSTEEESPAPAEEVAAASEPEAKSGQEDIDKLFAEAVSQQLNGSLQDSADSSTEDQSSPTSEQSQEDIDSLWASALEEASGTQQPDTADSDKKKADEPYTVDGDQFQSDLENLLESANQRADTSTAEAETQELPATEPPASDDAGETTAIEITPAEEDIVATESELSDSETSAEDAAGEESYEEEMETDIETISESEQESLKEKVLFYKDMVIFFLTDKRKVVKFLIPAVVALLFMSGGGYWYFTKQGNSEMRAAKVDGKETITLAKVDKETEIIEPTPAKEAKKAVMPESISEKENKPGDQIAKAKEDKIQEKETKQKVIPGTDIPVSKGKDRSISIGSIVPVVFNPNETRVMSLNIKLAINDQKVYEQVKKGLPFFEDKAESTIEKYFEGKFYKDIQFVQEKLGEELYKKLNQEITGGKIKKVELENFLIQ